MEFDMTLTASQTPVPSLRDPVPGKALLLTRPTAGRERTRNSCIYRQREQYVHVATVDEKTKTLVAEANSAIHGTVDAMVYGDNYLYTFGTSGGLNTFLTGFSVRLKAMTNGNGRGNIFRMGGAGTCGYSAKPYLNIHRNPMTSARSMSIVCDQSSSSQYPSAIHTFDNVIFSNNLGPAENFTLDITLAGYFLPISGGLGQAGTFALLKKSSQLYSFGKDAGGKRYLDAFPEVNVTDIMGESSDDLPSSSSSRTGIIVGCIEEWFLSHV
ncbi:hypothetical protein BGX33_008954 [Mortierella sp. NVP41]|nr:hypothetical protein BGX33_008954 [Mortierella sp. NVP41]